MTHSMHIGLATLNEQFEIKFNGRVHCVADNNKTPKQIITTQLDLKSLVFQLEV